jgi:hypothetical protein
MARRKAEQESRRESPIQFRPGSELGHLINSFASGHGLSLAEGCRALIALAVTEMDCRYFELIHQMAEAIGGENCFARACLHVHTALAGARRTSNSPLQLDPERSLFIERTAYDFLAARGLQEQARGLEFVPKREQEQTKEVPGPTMPNRSSQKKIDPLSRKKRTIRMIPEPADPTEDRSTE